MAENVFGPINLFMNYASVNFRYLGNVGLVCHWKGCIWILHNWQKEWEQQYFQTNDSLQQFFEFCQAEELTFVGSTDVKIFKNIYLIFMQFKIIFVQTTAFVTLLKFLQDNKHLQSLSISVFIP